MPSHDSRGKNLEVLKGINTDEGQLKLCDSTAATGSETVIVWVYKPRLFTIQKCGKVEKPLQLL